MKQEKVISGTRWDEIQQLIVQDFSSANMHDYHVQIQEEGRDVRVDIMSSYGGSEEGGYDTTTITSVLPANNDFRFAIHPEDFLYKIGKLFGVEDVITGYPEFDENVIVKTNKAEKVKSMFADAEVRKVFQGLSGYNLKVVNDEDKHGSYLELYIQRAIVNSTELLNILKAYYKVLVQI